MGFLFDCLFGIFVLLFSDLLFQMAFKCNAQGLSSIPKCKKVVLCLVEKNTCVR